MRLLAEVEDSQGRTIKVSEHGIRIEGRDDPHFASAGELVGVEMRDDGRGANVELMDRGKGYGHYWAGFVVREEADARPLYDGIVALLARHGAVHPPVEHVTNRAFGLTEHADQTALQDADSMQLRVGDGDERAIRCACPCDSVGEHNSTVTARLDMDRRAKRRL